MTDDRMRTITRATPRAPASLDLVWSDGTTVTLDLAETLRCEGFQALQRPAEFAGARLGDWGHSIVWPSGAELGADALWLETLSALQRSDTRQFLEWRLKHGLSLTGAAEALGLSRRMIAYYSNAEKPVPRHVLLACRGWEATQAARRRPRPLRKLTVKQQAHPNAT